ncbi:uncharacterized protein LOC119688440 [Teleopsis dalmanni]|uniref:uncharacterized protein LOC119688440 n=1 Tax=Teleopsis dalmanni TaxID=139649 RepID=UPI0018CF099B|nr:uncharacterized protein LOC119688440 [Teleopsis dalmanni]
MNQSNLLGCNLPALMDFHSPNQIGSLATSNFSASVGSQQTKEQIEYRHIIKSTNKVEENVNVVQKQLHTQPTTSICCGVSNIQPDAGQPSKANSSSAISSIDHTSTMNTNSIQNIPACTTTKLVTMDIYPQKNTDKHIDITSANSVNNAMSKTSHINSNIEQGIIILYLHYIQTTQYIRYNI